MNKPKEEPRLEGCVTLSGKLNEYRIRSGNYRILYTIEDDALVVQMIKIGNRKGVYKKSL
ncbi:type II toxin-antitoxin system RelE family toxin [Portibacter marinus]|uniref:type II toxin-antitoxin system RelE family toxin n=1 Tax=Portibacter marinus TaxID=2898660 RepID=UPI003873309D